MGNTRIEWTDKTFNAWWGCTPVSPSCDHCYADTLARRWGHDVFQHRGPRRMLSDDYWRKPLPRLNQSNFMPKYGSGSPV
ncbi:DUF5131 family protein [Streptomyces sp. NPDC052287]|uniref:DUF5131 family protein n=1 Tax=Streptomyces sp. NPDC052287 TaxID=3154950 RepID=UPI003424AE8A